MADLAVALVNLGISAERRRTERRNLREAVPMVVAEMLRHLRVDDHVTIRGDANECEGDRTYRVEQVTWNLQYIDPDHGYPSMPEPHPKGAPTLVLYPDTPALLANHSYTGAVLLDVRSLPREHMFYPADDHGIERCRRGGEDDESYEARLHLATDDERARFAADALRIIEGFSRAIGSTAEWYRRLTREITKLAPR